jgi:TonB family protein
MNAGSAYDAPEASDGSSAAGDIWALGITLCEALARRQPSGLHRGAGDVELPSDLHPPFREIVARCLRRNPLDRPDVAELQAWLRAEHGAGAAVTSPQPADPQSSQSAVLEPAADQPASADESLAQSPVVERTEPQAASVAATGPQSAEPPAFKLVIRAEIIPEDEPQIALGQHWNKRAIAVALVLGAVAVIAVSWVGIRVFRTEPTTAPAATVAARVEEPQPSAPAPTPREATTAAARAVQPQSATPAPAPREAATVVSDEPPPSPAPSAAEADGSPSPINEVIPDVPRSALQTIRGTVRVSVRVIVDKQGAVLAAMPEDPGPSRYFERLAIEASKKWTFAPADTEKQRLMLVRFNFTRAGTTARANPL